jgi:hypothetical protein
MRLSIKALAITAALLWGGALLFAGLINLAAPSYAAEYLKLMSSIYAGYHASRTVVDLLVGFAYALVDGALGGLLFGWLYNLFAGSPARS